MAVPAEPLELKQLDTDEWLLDELQLFEPGGFSVRGFKKFLAERTNWTAAQAGLLTNKERRAAMDQIIAKVNEAAVPKASGAGS